MQIVSKIHTLAATYRAVNDLLQNRLKSRNVHSEIVFSLSPNNNVRSSLASSSPFRYPPFCFFRLVPPCSIVRPITIISKRTLPHQFPFLQFPPCLIPAASPSASLHTSNLTPHTDLRILPPLRYNSLNHQPPNHQDLNPHLPNHSLRNSIPSHSRGTRRAGTI
jgi:hypothetical protein